MDSGPLFKRKAIFRVLAIAIVGVIFYVGVWPFIVGGSRMETFCSSLSYGLSVADVTRLAAQKDYRLGHLSKDQQAFVHESRSMGRFLCALEFREDRLVSAKYVFND